MKIIDQKITREELKTLAKNSFGNLVKAVVDIDKRVMAIGGELHSDEESLLLKQGSKQEDLWGINLYPEMPKKEMIEFDSMINLRPSLDNLTRGIRDLKIRAKIIKIIDRLII